MVIGHWRTPSDYAEGTLEPALVSRCANWQGRVRPARGGLDSQ